MPTKLIVLDDGQYKKFEIGESLPYKQYLAAPLISCHAYLFNYETPGSKYILFYHIPSGMLTREMASTIAKIISEDKADLSKVKVSIAIPQTIKAEKEVLIESRKHLVAKKITMVPEVVAEKVQCYIADTQGHHGVSIDLPPASPKMGNR